MCIRPKHQSASRYRRSGKYQEAHGLYTEALEIDPANIFTNSKLYNNRATVSSKVRFFHAYFIWYNVGLVVGVDSRLFTSCLVEMRHILGFTFMLFEFIWFL